ncbi:LOB domain-containing protein 1-like [Cryptomeria japonica]|uniref:LOB domain-containing protein 1-like n=1 Tax=Cryptomeria japonica TaxID=3369 RepID=UPI0027DAAD01|nr:LOB domain-containing protein 1-like [Cryptomeria japonica]
MAPHFPYSDPHRFEVIHRVFGTSHVLRTLQGLKENERAGAVSSMVIEANARLENPVHGCASAVYQLQKQIAELGSELAITQAEVVRMSRKRDVLSSIVTGDYHLLPPTQQNDNFISEDVDDLWEPLWISKV